MSISDPIGDMITRMRNGASAKKRSVPVPHSNFRVSVLDVLQSEGYIRGYRIEEVRSNIKQIVVELKYVENQPVITAITRKSTPGMRQYVPCDKMPKVSNGLGICILSTSKGVMSDIQARAQGIGGELLCTVF